MIYLTLFLTFLKIGAVSFGGGYGMISLIRETVLENAWLTEEEFLNFIAVAESTPGPLAVNMATFIGSAQAGFFGALVATLGVVLPSFVIILIIAALIKNLLKYAGVKSVLSGIRPTIVGLILATALTMFVTQIFGFTSVGRRLFLQLARPSHFPRHRRRRCPLAGVQKETIFTHPASSCFRAPSASSSM